MIVPKLLTRLILDIAKDKNAPKRWPDYWHGYWDATRSIRSKELNEKHGSLITLSTDRREYLNGCVMGERDYKRYRLQKYAK